MLAVTTFPSTAEVVIIGGGAVGLSVAYALAQRGVAAVVLERARVGSGASSGTACMITPSHSDRTASPAAFASGFPLQAMFGLDRGFETYDDTLTRGTEGWLERPAPETAREQL